MREEDGHDWDGEWIKLQQEIERGPREQFRTWTPAEVDDEAFDPADLPPAEPIAPASQPVLSRLFFLVTGAVAVLFILGVADVLYFSRDWWMVFGMIGLVSAAAGVYFSAPWAHRQGDDGTRV
ncbi:MULTISPECIES: hypothetical protein [Trueperella]|uniref:Uncharacterized protein n=1 Tax=Trueperella bernardiae TaxID=59561 RepID=A0A0W1KLQ8_9ACTO|nr:MULTISPECIES: hypothetical protein [Trueperella]KTF04900.1 hypothetical protein AQZ59_00203 [Trueperella bernardiae]MCM3906502.1 hypothetical protein [Trueperella bernardiae]OFS75956.1 hypothetical protein HMPREF3167_01355 [Trueperella sp. HMSC08B05]